MDGHILDGNGNFDLGHYYLLNVLPSDTERLYRHVDILTFHRCSLVGLILRNFLKFHACVEI